MSDAPDYDALIRALEQIEPVRDLARGLVAQWVDDGFTDEQARYIVVWQLTGYRWNNDPPTPLADDDRTEGTT